MLNIAVVEDNDDLRRAMVGALQREGHHVIGAESAESFIEQPAAVSVDILILDLGLPGEDGISLTRRIRDVQPHMGVIIVTARSRTQDKTTGYEAGADMFLTKPLPIAELNAAVAALSRRLRPREGATADLVLESARYTLRGPTGDVQLAPQEATLLVALARAAERRLETWQILELVQRGDELPGRNAITVAVFRLAQKIRQATGEDKPIRSIRNWGYELRIPVRVE